MCNIEANIEYFAFLKVGPKTTKKMFLFTLMVALQK